MTLIHVSYRIFLVYSIEHVVPRLSMFPCMFISSPIPPNNNSKRIVEQEPHRMMSVAPDNYQRIRPKTPDYYRTKDYPSLPLHGWFKPCLYPDCGMITGNRISINMINYPCCARCKKYADCVIRLKDIRFSSDAMPSTSSHSV